MTTRPVADLLVTLAEPTRLRILHCVSVAPLFVSDLVEILGVPEDVIAAEMDLLEQLKIVRAVPVTPYTLYTLPPLPGPRERLVRALLDAVRSDPASLADRRATLQRSRARLNTRVPAVMDAS